MSTANYDFRPVQLKRSLQRHPARVASAGGHERRFKRKSRTSALPPIPDIIAASHRLASYQSDPRRGMARRREHRQVAGAARGSPQLARPNEVCGGTLTMSAPRRLVLQLRRYRCNVATAASGESREGISPPRAPKTVREPLDSHGFRCSASDIHEPPMSKEVWIGTANPSQPISCAFGSFAQALVLSARPAD